MGGTQAQETLSLGTATGSEACLGGEQLNQPGRQQSSGCGQLLTAQHPQAGGSRRQARSPYLPFPRQSRVTHHGALKHPLFQGPVVFISCSCGARCILPRWEGQLRGLS